MTTIIAKLLAQLALWAVSVHIWKIGYALLGDPDAFAQATASAGPEGVYILWFVIVSCFAISIATAFAAIIILLPACDRPEGVHVKHINAA